ncbi:hypothetical protein [Halomonas sp. LBP4]|uniref:hypothetical protein n=1 Tax=Halomonas sp. LBP4 TaxID=2044917 RepID=UPI000D752954|nr:hypothetical protein [Halomonas sp. LBP4]PXX95943.1 hypothetical protein CR157_17270 [Halomonas sp. LBP4]
MSTKNTVRDDRLYFTEAEQAAFGRCGTLTLLAIALQVLLYPDLGVWAAAVIGACGTVPIMLAYGRNKPLLFSVAIATMAGVGMLAQFIYGLFFRAAFGAFESLLALT